MTTKNCKVWIRFDGDGGVEMSGEAMAAIGISEQSCETDVAPLYVVGTYDW